MKKFQLKRIGASEAIGNFDSKADAVDAMNEIIEDENDDLNPNVKDYLTPFDFECAEIEVTKVEELADYEAAKKYIGLVAGVKTTSDFNPNHIKALIALNTLFTIAEAWNKVDGFVPDFSNHNQYKWFPCFRKPKSTAGFVYANANYAAAYANAHIGSRLCFKSSERARQFGEQFIELWNDVLLFR
jgi:hypothetical protein